jgi:hypothetical protein
MGQRVVVDSALLSAAVQTSDVDEARQVLGAFDVPLELDPLQCELVDEAVTLHGHGEEIRLSPHLRWELQQLMSRVRPEDLSNVEIAALLAIVRPAHSRVIGGTAGRPGLRILGLGDEQPTPKLA